MLADALHRPILVILVELKAIVDINGFGLDAGGADHFHLFGFAVVESRGMFERIKMIFVEGLFGDGRTELAHASSSLKQYRSARVRHGIERQQFVHVARHQLQTSVAKSLAALIVERDPTDEFKNAGFWWRDDVITGLPIHAAGYVAEFRGRRTGLIAKKVP